MWAQLSLLSRVLLASVLDPGRVCSLFSVVSARWSPVLGSEGGRNRIARPTCDCCCPSLPHSWGLPVSPSAACSRDSPWYPGEWLGTTKVQSEAGLSLWLENFLGCWTCAQAGWVPANACIVLSLHCWTVKALSFSGETQKGSTSSTSGMVCGSSRPAHHGCECPRVCLNCFCLGCCRSK